MAPDARVINLETSVTRSAEYVPDKPVHYRISPENLPAVTVARPDACALANNHCELDDRCKACAIRVLPGPGCPSCVPQAVRSPRTLR